MLQPSSNCSAMSSMDTETRYKEDLTVLKSKLQDEEDVLRALLRQAVASRYKVETMRAKLKQHENTLQVQPSHVSILPDDILVLIIRQVLVDTPNAKGCYRLLELSHVCTYWRTLTVGTPSLWAMDILMRPNQSDTLLNLYLERAQQSLLSIRILSGVFGAFNKGRGVQLADTLSRCIQRCRSLKISVPRECPHLFERLKDAHAPFLKELVLEGGRADDFLPPLPLFQGGAPMLMSLELSSLSRRCQIGFDPKALTSLCFTPRLWFLEEMDFDTLRAPLQELPFLTNLTLDEVPLYFATPKQPIAIELGCLRFLRFIIGPQRCCKEDAACSTLSLIRAPFLSHLEINLSKQPRASEKFSNYLQINPPTYHELHTLTLHQASDIAHSVASAFHNITSLQVIGCMEGVLDILESSDNGVYWKRLQELVLECPRIDIRKLTSVIRKRKKSGYPFSKVEFDGAVECNGARQLDDWLHAQLGDVDNRLTYREVLEICTSLDAA